MKKGKETEISKDKGGEYFLEATGKIDKCRYKTYVLQELFAHLSNYQGNGSPVRDIVLFSFGVETILGEIVSDSEAAYDCIANLSNSRIT